ncbi:MAG: DUF1501 domain-containing protein [Myxococcales bacterium]|nr:DUF1501 domain-containing protein [Myxococcales bacterium]MCB9643620.1 DUF1501 domain-containing protein [Myxococcales bacterium]
MFLSRRFFLKSLGLGAAGTFALGPWRAPKAQAAVDTDRRFVFCYFSGGWDTLLSLDPREYGFADTDDAKSREMRVEPAYYRLRTTFTDGNTVKRDLIQPEGSKILYGPAMEPMARHFDQTCIVRGISMDTVTHEVGRRYFITGLPPRGLLANGSSGGTRIVAQQGKHRPIPNLVVRVESYNQGMPAYASGLKVSNVDDLLRMLRDGDRAPDAEVRALLEAYRKEAESCDPVSLNADGLLSLLRGAQLDARALIEEKLTDNFSFLDSSKPDMVEIKKRYNITSMSSPQAQAALAFQALKFDVAQTISVELANGLDTHFENWEDDQPERQYQGWKALAQLVDDLKSEPNPRDPSKKLIDNTTIVVFSEFARTPMINNREGRDHWLVNSSLLLGAGVPHNKVVGASTAQGMNASAVDPITGEPTKVGGTVINPRLIMASLMEGAGLDASDLRVSGLPCLMNKS